MNQEAIKSLIYQMADDQLIIGHRNSEWTGIGPIIEEDIAFSSMAQDKIGHAWNMYQILQNILGEANADDLAFKRKESEFRSCHLVEMPIGEFDYSLVRHFFNDYAEMTRFEDLANSSFDPLAKLAKRIKGEIKYHILHADTWMMQLAKGTEESKIRMQSAINEIFPLAFGIFELSEYEADLIKDGVYSGEKALEARWLKTVSEKLESWGYKIPVVKDKTVGYGGRKGYHTEFLNPLLLEMTEVTLSDPSAEW